MALVNGVGFGRVICIEVSCSKKQLTASNTAQPNKIYPGIKGRIVGIRPVPGVIGAGTAATGIALDVRKGTTLLHATSIPLQSSSTLATTDAILAPTLSTTAATRAIAIDDYLACDVTLTGGSTITLDGTGVLVYIARE
jgi:hypothetical protein